MKSPKNKTQQQRTKVKNLSAILAIGLAVVTLFQAGTVKSEKTEAAMTSMEAEIINDIDAWFDSEEMELEESLLEEAIEQTVNTKVFDMEGNLIMQGEPSNNEALRQLVNQSEFMSKLSGTSYYAMAK